MSLNLCLLISLSVINIIDAVAQNVQSSSVSPAHGTGISLGGTSQFGFTVYVGALLAPAVGGGSSTATIDIASRSSGAGGASSTSPNNAVLTASRRGDWTVNYLGWGTVNCKVSSWSDWQSCSVRCGAGVQKRTRTILQHPVAGGLACPSSVTKPGGLVQWRKCDQQQCFGKGKQVRCGGISPLGSTDWFGNVTAWRKFGNRGVMVDVDTTMCKFKSTPYYFLSIVGDTSFQDDWRLLGTNAIAKAEQVSTSSRPAGQ